MFSISPKNRRKICIVAEGYELDTVKNQFSSVTQSCPTLCDPTECSTPGFHIHHQLPELSQNSCPSSWWCHPIISSSVVLFSSCLQSLKLKTSQRSFTNFFLLLEIGTEVSKLLPMGEIQLLDFIKFPWNIAMFLHLYTVYGCFHVTELSSCDRDHMTGKS